MFGPLFVILSNLPTKKTIIFLSWKENDKCMMNSLKIGAKISKKKGFHAKLLSKFRMYIKICNEKSQNITISHFITPLYILS